MDGDLLVINCNYQGTVGGRYTLHYLPEEAVFCFIVEGALSKTVISII